MQSKVLSISYKRSEFLNAFSIKLSTSSLRYSSKISQGFKKAAKVSVSIFTHFSSLTESISVMGRICYCIWVRPKQMFLVAYSLEVWNIDSVWRDKHSMLINYAFQNDNF